MRNTLKHPRGVLPLLLTATLMAGTTGAAYAAPKKPVKVKCHVLKNGKKVWTTKCPTKPGTPGANGTNGVSTNGKDGAAGANGAQGAKGDAGANGHDGINGHDGAKGVDGTSTNGKDGASAFDIWSMDNDGSMQDFLDS